MMKTELLQKQFQQIGLTESLSKNQEIRFFDRSLNIVCDVCPSEELSVESIINQARSFLEAPAPSVNDPLRFIIHLPFELVQNTTVEESLLKLSDLFSGKMLSHLMIHSPSPPQDWGRVREMIKHLREKSENPRSYHVECIAPFSSFDEKEMEELFNLGMRIRYAAGWLGESPSSALSQIQKNVLGQLSQMGFSCPIEWYVHGENISKVELLLPDLLYENYSSGFSLPLVSENPFYRFDPGFPALPDASDYADLLVRCYHKYHCYDSVIEPLAGLAMQTRVGAWHKELNQPRTIRLNIDRAGNVGFFLQSPSLAKNWITTETLATSSLKELKKNFVEMVTAGLKRKSSPECRECSWEMLCGGLDETNATQCGNFQKETLCLYRKLFIRHFVSMRAAHLRIERKDCEQEVLSSQS